ncbi:hypothetical protein [Myxococcus xanthus]|uniref:Lipoprotein n=1 Tax=Myxococcus xanthus TaxID=34 RepID=A0AAE6FX01_MYXXA|nr:hypothetical protein [Myxococcus xanthus]QDE66679.1 hypothetical protein BHS09_06465 [Myxococcus xanthus]QDE73952.1 hypothetical protein BHS08_06470 [Myxococcus xanthus]QDE81215.1 hypothetical protein BHS07_06360 [Myxococcus xanthus]QDE95546.1 hypothetical protein BHS05_06480 [Myxococcus xanthus]
MRWSSALLLPLCLATTACGTSAKHQALLERRDAIRLADVEREQVAREQYRSSSGFQDTRWGMTKDEAMSALPFHARVINEWGDVHVADVVAGRRADAYYVFAQGQLAEVTLHFHAPGAVRDNFNSVAELLTMKYGKPASLEDSARDAEGRLALAQMANNLSEASANYHAWRSGEQPGGPAVDNFGRQMEANARTNAALAAHEYLLQGTWDDKETGLLLSGSQEPGARSLTLTYTSLRLKPYLSKELAVRDQQRKVEQSREL